MTGEVVPARDGSSGSFTMTEHTVQPSSNAMGAGYGPSCEFPPKPKAVEALLGLAWRTDKRHRPDWLIAKVNAK